MTQNDALFTGRLVRLAAATPEDLAIVAQWSTDADLLRRLKYQPVRPLNQQEVSESFWQAGTGTTTRICGYAPAVMTAWWGT
jgi:hypothetical protein